MHWWLPRHLSKGMRACGVTSHSHYIRQCHLFAKGRKAASGRLHKLPQLEANGCAGTSIRGTTCSSGAGMGHLSSAAEGVHAGAPMHFAPNNEAA